MRITLELDKKQVAHLKKALDTSLSSLAWEEAKVKDALEGENTKEQEANLQEYLVGVSCQRVIVAEILGTLNQADPEHNIITDGIAEHVTKLSRRKSRF